MKILQYVACLLFISLSIHPLHTIGQSNSGPKSGGTFTNDNSIGSISFNSPGNAGSPDNLFSSASATLSLFSASTNYLKATGFGFSIPNNAAVSGIVVEVEKSAVGINILASVSDNAVRLVKNGTATGSNRAKGANWTTTPTYYTYGGSNDLWGTTWTRAEINSANFGIAFSADINGLISVLPSAQIDHMRVTVYFNIVLPTSVTNFSVETSKDHSANLEWLYENIDENSVLNVQRKTTSSDWKTIQSFKEKTTRYTDADCKSEQAQYRLQIQQADGSYNYSNIVTAKWDNSSLTLYPNPAKNEIFVNATVKATYVYCSSTDGDRWRLPVISTNSILTRIDTQQLPTGTYILNINGKKQVFIKH